jgi:hypothetical protein
MKLLIPVAISLLMLASCSREHETWVTRTGTSADQNIYPTAAQAAAPSGGSYALTGCLNGSNAEFTLTDANSGTVYMLRGNYDALKEHVGELVGLNGNRSDAPGVPEFEVKGPPATVAAVCPPTAAGATKELNLAPPEKRGIKQAEFEPSPHAAPGVTTPPASAVPRGQAQTPK